MKIRLMVSGRNYQAAMQLPDELDLTDDATLDAALARLEELMPEGASLSPNSLVAVAGTHVGTLSAHPDKDLRDGDELVVVAPVAGG
jgi:molybdopterin converting factor small subunit